MNFLKSFLILFSVAFCSQMFFAQEKLPLIPYPQKVEMKEGFFKFSNTINVQPGEILSNEFNFYKEILKEMLKL